VASAAYGNTQTHKDEGRVQVLIVLPGVVSVKLFRFPAVCGEEVGSGVVDPEGFNELLEGGMEPGRLGCQRLPDRRSILDNGSDARLWIDLNDRWLLLL